jgi:peptidoglycan/LPS O-acetylase OafA/YrhL
MRWVAALLVFTLHVRDFGFFGGGGTAPRIVNWAGYPGLSGVSFFFVLSGFVLAWSARDGDRARVFWRRRFARVYPLHLVTAITALVLAFTLIPGMQERVSRGGVIANFALVHAWSDDLTYRQSLNPVSWTLACEAFFYACFPLLAWALRKLGPRGMTVVAGLSVLTVILLPYVDSRHPIGLMIPINPLVRVPEFVLGVCLGLLVKSGRWRGPGLQVALAVSIVGYFLVGQVPPQYAYTSCTIIGFALLVAAGAQADLRGSESFWRHPVMVRLGELSFAFYMVHLLVLTTWRQLFPGTLGLSAVPGALVVLTLLAIALGLSWLLYEYVEVPGRRLIVSGLRRKRPAPVSAKHPAGEQASDLTGVGTTKR